METTALLIPQSELQKYLTEIARVEEGTVRDLKIIIPYVKSPSLRVSLLRRLNQGESYLVALKAGFVPVEGAYLTKTDTKSKWAKKDVDATLASMPEEVKQAWKKAEETGIFDSFSVTTRRVGDPLLVGNKGGKHFFIAGWLPISKGVSLGIRVRL
jgi:hypothetical protein